MKNKDKKHIIRQIFRKLLLQYLLTIFAFIVLLFIMIFIASLMITSRTWYDIDVIYLILRTIADNLGFFVWLTIAGGIIIISIIFIYRAVKYIESIFWFVEETAEGKPASALPSELYQFEDYLTPKLQPQIIVDNDENFKNASTIIYLAHDLKTPLTSILGYLTLLKDEPDLPEKSRASYVDIIMRKALRLEELINEFFEMTILNMSEVKLEYTNVNLERMFEQILFESEPLLTEKKLQSNIAIDTSIQFTCDNNKMERVFTNLLNNAISYSYPDSTITIDATETPNSLEINFTNHCPTIPADDLEKIFDPFYRLDYSRSSRTGKSGIGLSIVKKLVVLHNGTIEASSENDIVTFKLRFPK
ncbi:sensor histidine kinase [Culicoidibacter larvae]|uniref:histidine kinase n=1 Tax=Culicoidibacter larvae TaxID=2579976 RepID=A0A5R8QG11_9FIRM|nr:HAMP domain-containing sensor histidine kinase [Culicoidibacter larvae]TLG75413.1 HAMP domain-containing histidine kinase [Culicoidibacter larvae]